MHPSTDYETRLTLRIGGQIFALRFRGASREIVPFFHVVFRGFMVHDRQWDHRLDIYAIPRAGREILAGLRTPADHPEDLDEYALTREELTDWIRSNRKWAGRIRLSGRTLGVQSLGGLLFYAPETACGSVFLPRKDRYPYRSLYRLFWIFFTQAFGEQGACFLHAAGIERKGEGFVFIGGTGTGKSTLARRAGNGFAMGDEAPVITDGDGMPRIYPSPYHQMAVDHVFRKHQRCSGVPVRSLYFVIKDHETFVEPVSKTDAVAMIMARYIHFFFFVSPEAKVKIFDLFYHTCHKFPVYCLHFAVNTDIWKVIP